jgi:hypothetical protein
MFHFFLNEIFRRLTMSTKLILSSIAGLTLIAVSALGNAAENPLAPTYQKFNVAIAAPATGEAARYVDRANPLAPTFTRSGEAGNWVSTALRADQLYRDTANPLHPSFKRI